MGVVDTSCSGGSSSGTLTSPWYHMWFSVAGSALAMIPAAVFVPAMAILKAVLYISIRSEKEGLTAEQLVQDMGGQDSRLLSPSEMFAYQQVAVNVGEDGTTTVEDAAHPQSSEVDGPII